MTFFSTINKYYTDPQNTRVVFAWAIVVICAISLGTNLNTLRNEFVYDDIQQVLANPWIQEVNSIPDIFTTGVWNFESNSSESNYYRPMMHIIYMLTFQLFGPASWGFHLVNILLHTAVSVLVFLVTREFFARGLPAAQASLLPAFAAALLFATHPIHTEVVAWVAAIPELSYSLFLLLSLYFYSRSQAGRHYAYTVSVICFSLAALSKEPALILPVILFFYDHTLDTGKERCQLQFRRYLPYLIVAVSYLALRYHALGGFVPQKPHTELSPWGYIINIFPLFMHYLLKLLAPVNLNLFHMFHPISSLFQLQSGLSLLVAAGYAACAYVAYKKDKLIFLGLILIILPLLPALYIPALSVNVFSEHHLYFPSFGFVLLFAGVFSRLQASRPRYTGALIVAILALTVLYSAGSISRNAVWRNELTLYRDTLNKSPQAVEIHLNLGNVYADLGLIQEAIAEYKKTIDLAPGYAEAHNNLGILYYDQGRFQEAIAEYQTALSLKPAYAEAHNNLGNAYAALGRTEAAYREYSIVLQLKPDNLMARKNLELLLRRSR